MQALLQKHPQSLQAEVVDLEVAAAVAEEIQAEAVEVVEEEILVEVMVVQVVVQHLLLECADVKSAIWVDGTKALGLLATRKNQPLNISSLFKYLISMYCHHPGSD